jgi:hypothetical protein
VAKRPSHLWKPGTSGNANGRPKAQVAARELPKITKLAASGVREKDIARAIGISAPTWTKLKADDPKLLAAFEAGQQQFHDLLVADALRMSKRGNVAATIFMLKARHGYRENEVIADNRPHVIINLPAAVPLDQYVKVVEQVPDTLTAAVPEIPSAKAPTRRSRRG